MIPGQLPCSPDNIHKNIPSGDHSILVGLGTLGTGTPGTGSQSRGTPGTRPLDWPGTIKILSQGWRRAGLPWDRVGISGHPWDVPHDPRGNPWDEDAMVWTAFRSRSLRFHSVPSRVHCRECSKRSGKTCSELRELSNTLGTENRVLPNAAPGILFVVNTATP